MMPKRIALIGRSDLAESFQQDHSHHVYQRFFRPDYDLTLKPDCDRIIEQADADIFLITAGAYHGDAWTLWMTNCVGPSYLAYQLNQTRNNIQIIIVSSLGSRWVAWPGIDGERLVYNAAKHATSHFVQELYHSNVGSNRITVIDPGRFQSRINNNTGMTRDRVTKVIEQVIDTESDANVMHVQVAWHRDRINQPGDKHDK